MNHFNGMTWRLNINPRNLVSFKAWINIIKKSKKKTLKTKLRWSFAGTFVVRTRSVGIVTRRGWTIPFMVFRASPRFFGVWVSLFTEFIFGRFRERRGRTLWAGPSGVALTCWMRWTMRAVRRTTALTPATPLFPRSLDISTTSSSAPTVNFLCAWRSFVWGKRGVTTRTRSRPRSRRMSFKC